MGNNYKDSLRFQIRESYGKLVYTYTSYNKEIHRLQSRYDKLKNWQIWLSAITTGGLLSAVISQEYWLTVVSCIVSTIYTGVGLYFKNYDFIDLIRQYRMAADELWNVREEYIALLTDMDTAEIEDVVVRRDSLKNRVYEIYKTHPKTDNKSYELAKKALKNNEEQFFSDEEIDQILPSHLRLNKSV